MNSIRISIDKFRLDDFIEDLKQSMKLMDLELVNESTERKVGLVGKHFQKEQLDENRAYFFPFAVKVDENDEYTLIRCADNEEYSLSEGSTLLLGDTDIAGLIIQKVGNDLLITQAMYSEGLGLGLGPSIEPVDTFHELEQR